MPEMLEVFIKEIDKYTSKKCLELSKILMHKLVCFKRGEQMKQLKMKPVSQERSNQS